ncbi:MAG: hypothetical protein Q9195_005536 [Heterodermia aff. obscurata]
MSSVKGTVAKRLSAVIFTSGVRVFLQILKVTHEEARGNGVDEDGLLVERIAEFVGETNGHGHEVARAGVEMASAGGMKADFAFLPPARFGQGICECGSFG